MLPSVLSGKKWKEKGATYIATAAVTAMATAVTKTFIWTQANFSLTLHFCSLAGPGKKTPELAVSINERPSKLLLPILLPLFVALIIAAGVGYVYFKKQRAMGDETTCNPIYLNVSISLDLDILDFDVQITCANSSKILILFVFSAKFW